MIRSIRNVALLLLIPAPAIAAEAEDGRDTSIRWSGIIDDRRVVEASGLARSHLVANRLWTMNDNGSKPELFALGMAGEIHGSVSLSGARNIDWEDLASFEHGGKAWLLVADIGDNEARRRFCTLYVVEEPAEAIRQNLKPARVIRFAYPDGPLDAESVAVDASSNSVLILTKRTVPARLYRVPLFGTDDHVEVAERLGEVASIPQPSQSDLDRAHANQSWHWQPTAMDISNDGRLVVILSYRAAYLFARDALESWIDVMQKTPVRLDLGGIELAEAAAFGYKDQNLFVTVEGQRPPLYLFELNY